ncbi:MAG TPA: threonylcarbamoyl-AMP synthase [Bacteroidetes bacterium]|nr:threonylcarbamoyl-AMP synthase [Bacteroidota bacterium]
MLLQIHTENPEPRKIEQTIRTLEKGGVIIYPTDTVYGLGCDIFNKKAVEKICSIRHLDPRKAMLSFVCKDIGQVAEYAWQMDNQLFRLLKRNLPGPFTFILKSSNAVPKLLKNKKRTIGVRVPDNKIAQAIVEELGRPLLSISLISFDEQGEDETYLNEPWEINEMFGNLVDIVIDGGTGGSQPSSLVDCTEEPYTIIREEASVLQ